MKEKITRLRGENSSGFTNEQYLHSGAFSRDLLDQKSKSRLFPGVGGWGGGGGVVTNESIYASKYAQC